MQIPMRVLAVLLLTAGMAACGFQLRGWDAGVAAQIDSAYVTTAGPNLMEVPLRDGLRQAGVTQAATPEQAELVVRLIDARSERRSATVGEQARVAEYETTLTVLYEITDPQGRSLVPPQWLERSRVFRIDRENVVGSREEESLLELEMQNDLVQQIIRSLNAVAARNGGPG
jgi:outer membrane lipopolysaccharide assembly protein LptE/RlpB